MSLSPQPTGITSSAIPESSSPKPPVSSDAEYPTSNNKISNYDTAEIIMFPQDSIEENDRCHPGRKHGHELDIAVDTLCTQGSNEEGNKHYPGRKQ